VPFLPLERAHILRCIDDYLALKSFAPKNRRDFTASVADSLQYFPKGFGLFSTSGCKRIAQKVDVLIEQEMEPIEEQPADELESIGNDDNLL